MHRGLALLLPLLLVAATARAHPLGDFSVGNPAYVTSLLANFVTPDLAPGESGEFRFVFTNTYPWRMESIGLRLEIYLYRQANVAREVNGSTWPYTRPAFVDSSGIDRGLAYEPLIPPLNPREKVNVTVTIATDTEAPHGSLTDQGSYFVRTWLEFDLTDGTTANRSVMMSKDFFTNEQFVRAQQPCGNPCPPWVYYEGILNLTYLGSLYGLNHSDGLTPVTGFSVKDRMPLWPFVVVGGVMVASLVFALLFYVEENPGKFPRLAKSWMATKARTGLARPRRK